MVAQEDTPPGSAPSSRRSRAASEASVDRLARLAQQRQRLADQRARLAASRAGSQPLASSADSAAPVTGVEPAPALRSPGGEVLRAPVKASTEHASSQEVPHQAARKQTLQEKAAAAPESLKSGLPNSALPSWEERDSLPRHGASTSVKTPEIFSPQPSALPPPATKAGNNASIAAMPATDAANGEHRDSHTTAESPIHAPETIGIPFGLASAGGSGGDFFKGIDNESPSLGFTPDVHSEPPHHHDPSGFQWESISAGADARPSTASQDALPAGISFQSQEPSTAPSEAASSTQGPHFQRPSWGHSPAPSPQYQQWRPLPQEAQVNAEPASSFLPHHSGASTTCQPTAHSRGPSWEPAEQHAQWHTAAGAQHQADTSADDGSDFFSGPGETQGSSSFGYGPPAHAEGHPAAPENPELPSPFSADTLQQAAWQEEEEPQGQVWAGHSSHSQWGAQPEQQPSWSSGYPPQQQPLPSHSQWSSPAASQGHQPSWAYPPNSYTGSGAAQQHLPQNGHHAAPSAYEQQWQQAQSKSLGYQGRAAQASGASGAGSPHGRPPIPLVAFGFGGRAIVMKPLPAPVQTGEHSLAAGPLQLLRTQDVPGATAGAQSPHQGLPTASLQQTAQLLSSFPGILTSSANPQKVLDFVAQRAAAAAAEEAGLAAESLRLLWAVLGLCVQSRGSLKTGPEARRAKPQQHSIEKQLAALLGSGSGTVENRARQHLPSVLTRGSASSPASQEDAALAMQSLLQQGDRAAALRAAVEAQLWGPALLLSRSCGEAAFGDTAAACIAACLQAGSPLRALLGTAAGESPGPQGNNEELGDWQGCLAILAANRSPKAEAEMLSLGDKLWAASQDVFGAHLCYVVGGAHPSAYEPLARLCLPGGDHRNNPRTFASIPAIQRGLILDWAKQLGAGANLQSAAVMLPYRLILSASLAEFGQIEAASQHCSAITDALNALGSKLPSGLLVTRSLVNELQLRLQNHAQAFNIPIAHHAGGSLMSKAGKWLDKGLSKLIGASDLPEGAQEAASRPPAGANHRRSASQPVSPRAQMGRRVSSAGEMVVAAASKPQNLPTPSSATASPTRTTTSQPGASMDKAGSLSVRGLFGKVGSLTSLLGSGAAPVPKSEAELGSENTLYFDNELKLWREHGKPPPEPEAPLAPPPVSLPSAPPGREKGANSGGGVPNAPPPSGGGLPNAPPPGGVRSRYVDTIAVSGRQPSSGLTTKNSGSAAGLVPRPPAFFSPSGASRPAAPAFFTPTGGSQSQSLQPAWGAAPSGTSRTSSAELQQQNAAPYAGRPWAPSPLPPQPHGYNASARSPAKLEENRALHDRDGSMTDVTL